MKELQRMKDNQKHIIFAKEYITEKEYNEISRLQELCYAKDQTNLKLELDYKLYVSNNAKAASEAGGAQASQAEAGKKEQVTSYGTDNSNEFLYYVDDTLVAYLGICCFGGNIGEINGMTHPEWRRQGIFQQLFNLVREECLRRKFTKVLLLSDAKSEAGIAFIQSVSGMYETSEYRMKLLKYPVFDAISPVSLRVARNKDKKKIDEMNACFFGDENNSSDETEAVGGYLSAEDSGIGSEEPIETPPNTACFIAELSGEAIGKINIEYSDNSAFICGFGILPDFRRNGYGKAAIIEALRIIASKNLAEVSLDVVSTNSKALNLYISCGFEQQSVMNYYRY